PPMSLVMYACRGVSAYSSAVTGAESPPSPPDEQPVRIRANAVAAVAAARSGRVIGGLPRGWGGVGSVGRRGLGSVVGTACGGCRLDPRVQLGAVQVHPLLLELGRDRG